MSRKVTTPPAPKPAEPVIDRYHGPTGDASNPRTQQAIRDLAALRDLYGLPQPTDTRRQETQHANS